MSEEKPFKDFFRENLKLFLLLFLMIFIVVVLLYSARPIGNFLERQSMGETRNEFCERNNGTPHFKFGEWGDCIIDGIMHSIYVKDDQWRLAR